MQNINKINNQIKIGAIVSYIGIAVNIIIGLLYTPWMVKTIGQEDYALYTLVTSIITMFAIDFGMSAAVSRYVAKYKAEENVEKINNFLGIIYKLYIIVSMIVFIVLIAIFINLDRIYVNFSIEELKKFKIIFLIAGIYSVFSFPFVTFNGIISAYEKFVQLKICELFNKIGTVILVTIILFKGKTLYALVVANVFIGIATIIIKFYIIKKNTDINVNFRFFDFKLLKEIFSYSMWATIGSIAQNFLITITPSIIAIVANSSEVAIFGFSNSIGAYIYILATGIDGFFLPKVSRMIASHSSKEEFVNLMIKVGRFQFYILGIISVGFLILGKEFILLLMGREYLDAFYCVNFYLIYSIVCYPQQVANTMVIALNKVKERAIISIVAAIVNIILTMILSKFWGAIGACCSLCISILLRTVLLNILYRKKIGLDIVLYFKKCHLSLIVPLIFIGIISKILVEFISSFSWLFFIVKVLIIGIVYVIGMYILGLNNEEKEMIVRMLKK